MVLGGVAAPAGASSSGTVAVRATPSRLVLGRSATAPVRVSIQVRTPEGRPDAEAHVIVHTTAGRIDGVTRIAPGRYRALLQPPDQTFPQLAVVTAANITPGSGGAPEIGVATVAYAAAITLEGRTEPGARMEVKVGGGTFGPAVADGAGQFSLPVVVPPGEAWARAVSTDDLGNRTRSRINLYLPRVRQLHAFFYPEVVVADGRDLGWLFITTVTAAGAPQDRAVTVVPPRGQLQAPERLGPGLQRIPYHPPTEVGSGDDTFVVQAGDAETTLSLPLVAGAPTQIDVAAPPLIPADGTTAHVLAFVVRDAHGNIATGHEVLTTLGTEAVPAAFTDATYRVNLLPRKQIASTSLNIHVRPRARRCLRPTLHLFEDAHLLWDARGLPCDGRLALGATPTEAEVLVQGGRALGTVPPSGALSLHTASGVVPVVRAAAVWAPRSKPVKATVPVVYRLPVEGVLSIRVLERTAAGLRLWIEEPAQGGLSEHVEVDASHGEVSVQAKPGGLEAQWALTGQPPIAPVLVARDRRTGVVAWLRVE